MCVFDGSKGKEGGARPIVPLCMIEKCWSGAKAGRWMLSAQHAIFARIKKKSPADSLIEVFWNVTHRSNSSLGSFLLMTASSLFVNIWKGAEDNISTGSMFQLTGPPPSSTSLKDGRSK